MIAKTAIKSGVFIVLLVGLNFIADWGLNKFSHLMGTGEYYDFRRIIEQRPKILIMGASKAMNHYVTKIIEQETGLSTYNLGVGGSKVIVQYTQMLEIMNLYKPKIIIYEVIGDDFNNLFEGKNYIAPVGRYPSNSLLEKMRYRVDEYYWLHNIFPLYNYNLEGLSLLFRGFNKPDTDPNLGYTPIANATLPLLLKQKNDIKEEISEQGSSELLSLAFEKMLDLASENGINIIFFRSPYYRHPHANIPKEISPLLLSSISRHGFPYHDMSLSNNPAFRDSTNYKDFGHLADKGAKIYTRLIVPIIVESLKDSIASKE